MKTPESHNGVAPGKEKSGQDFLRQRLTHFGLTMIVMALFISLLVIAVIWNWIFNWVSLLKGSRLTCIKKVDNEVAVCGAPVSRKKVLNKKTGIVIPRYKCINGHKLPEAHFHPVKKGTLGHTLWVISLLFCVIIFFLS